MNAVTDGVLSPFEQFTLDIGFDQSDAQRMLVAASDLGCSDIVFQSEDFVTVYYNREWWPFTTRTLESTEVERILTMLAGTTAVVRVNDAGEIDDDPEFFREDGHRVRMRYRLNAVACRVGNVANGISVILRNVPAKIPEIADQKLNEELRDGLLPTRGLVLMVGQTGSGKTTTIAACINERTKEKPAPRTITYEEPPEISYGKKGLGNGPLISQVAIGSQLKGGWSRAGPTAMRRKADLILMGEVRDVPSASATMEMAISGHGVYGTMHADTPNEALFRFVEFFPVEARAAAASKLLGSLRTICAQKLIKTKTLGVVAIRSWVVFDAELKERMSAEDCPYPTWDRFIRAYLKERRQDFVSQCEWLIRKGEIDVHQFKEITLMSLAAAKKHVAEVLSTPDPEEETNGLE
jgi:defect-in-organelle-trafficking protein DotB